MSNVIPMLSASPPPMEETSFDTSWGDDDFGDFSSAPNPLPQSAQPDISNHSELDKNSVPVATPPATNVVNSLMKEVPGIMGNSEFVTMNTVNDAISQEGNWGDFSDEQNGNIDNDDLSMKRNGDFSHTFINEEEATVTNKISIEALNCKADAQESTSQDSVTDSGLFSDTSAAGKSDGDEIPNCENEKFSDFQSVPNLGIAKSDTGESLATLSPDKESSNVESAILENADVAITGKNNDNDEVIPKSVNTEFIRTECEPNEEESLSGNEQSSDEQSAIVKDDCIGKSESNPAITATFQVEESSKTASTDSEHTNASGNDEASIEASINSDFKPDNAVNESGTSQENIDFDLKYQSSDNENENIKGSLEVSDSQLEDLKTDDLDDFQDAHSINNVDGIEQVTTPDVSALKEDNASETLNDDVDDFADFSSAPAMTDTDVSKAETSNVSESVPTVENKENDSLNSLQKVQSTFPEKLSGDESEEESDDFGDFGSSTFHAVDSLPDFRPRPNSISETNIDENDEEEFAPFDSNQDFKAEKSSETGDDDGFANFETAAKPKDDDDDDEFANFEMAAKSKEDDDDGFANFETAAKPNDDANDGFANFESALDKPREGFAKFETTPATTSSGWANQETISNNEGFTAKFDEDDDDDFGDFGDFESTEQSAPKIQPKIVETPSINQKTSQQIKGRVEQSFPLNNEDSVQQITIDFLKAWLEKESEKIEKTIEGVGRSKSVKNVKVELNVWNNMKDIDTTNALLYHWSHSASRKIMLKALQIDTRNMLVGHKKPAVPVFASGLGLLEPSKGPSEPTKLEEPMMPALVDTSKVESAPATEEVCPPIQFDWSTSGLTNPLDALEKEFLNDLDSPKPEPSKLQPLENILANLNNPGTTTFSTVPSQVKVDEKLSKEANSVLVGLPNLAFMQAKVLMFPLKGQMD
ncbi:unnamed protein product [Owenia fusiformis]|uniref:Uncharacterized protein n=1 Tax=Owenia fusiformis TaxID=6347 RepID=A0A8J1U4L6_OWEFU|nr:unnamed protein product [Owenia fusiformis]